MEEGKTTEVRGRKKRVLIILAVGVFVALGMAAFWPGENEPQYDGKKLSEWLWIVGTNSTIDRQIINDSPNLVGITNVSPEGLEAVRAVRAIGTNAFPYLIRWTLDRPAWRWKLCSAYGKFPKCLQSGTVGGWILGGNDENFGLAIVGFQIMGPDEVHAVPEMARLLRDSNSDATKRNILFCLEFMTSRAHAAMPTLRDIAMQRPYRHYPSYIENSAVFLMDKIEPGSGAHIMTNVWAREPP